MAAKAQGFGSLRIIFRHVLPNAVTPVYVVATLGIGGAILTESALSFLGIGVQPPTPSWGNILTQAKDNIEVAWWLSVYPGLAIFLTVMGYNLLGEGLRDIFDPRRKGLTIKQDKPGLRLTLSRLTIKYEKTPDVIQPGFFIPMFKFMLLRSSVRGRACREFRNMLRSVSGPGILRKNADRPYRFRKRERGSRSSS